MEEITDIVINYKQYDNCAYCGKEIRPGARTVTDNFLDFCNMFCLDYYRAIADKEIEGAE